MTRAEVLSIRLARIGCELDDIASELDEQPLTGSDLILFGAPARHIAIGQDRIDRTLTDAEQRALLPPMLKEAA